MDSETNQQLRDRLRTQTKHFPLLTLFLTACEKDPFCVGLRMYLLHSKAFSRIIRIPDVRSGKKFERSSEDLSKTHFGVWVKSDGT